METIKLLAPRLTERRNFLCAYCYAQTGLPEQDEEQIPALPGLRKLSPVPGALHI